jgi:hypothetical protein
MRGRRRLLGVAILVWTLLAWGGRISLLTRGEDWADIGRIGVSLLLGITAAFVLLTEVRQRWGSLILKSFSIWTTVVWVRSLIVNWAGSESLAFKLVHSALAAGFLLLAYAARTRARAETDNTSEEARGRTRAIRTKSG